MFGGFTVHSELKSERSMQIPSDTFLRSQLFAKSHILKTSESTKKHATDSNTRVQCNQPL